MTTIPMDIEWRRTSRNTEIAVAEIHPYGEIFLKRSFLIKSCELNEHIDSFNLLQEITRNIEGATSPAIIEPLCVGNVIALELISHKSFHELWLDENYPQEQVLLDIMCLYGWLAKFHNATVNSIDQVPLCYVDFGPKNLIPLDDDCVTFIDPPLKFTRRDVFYDFGTLVFEIERSLIQAARPCLIWKSRELARTWVVSKKIVHPYQLYKKGIQRHVFTVVARYVNFYRKPRPIIEFLRGMVIVPCLIFYHILLSVYDLILQFKVK
jgi:hypothetical protein